MKQYFKFSDGSIAYLEDNGFWFSFKPVQVYTAQVIGFGEWIDYR